LAALLPPAGELPYFGIAAGNAACVAGEIPVSQPSKEFFMKTILTATVSLIAGVGIGMSINALHAQNRAPGAYAVVDIAELTDENAFRQELLPKVTPELLASFGGRYIVRTERVTATDGTPPARFVVIGFDSLDKAKAWDASPSQQEVNRIRKGATKSRQFLVEAFSN
jgi:uncharacterized protein (DUF1330 family)